MKFGYVDHPKVKSCFEWFVKTQAKLGGWSCFGSGRNLDSWEAMSAFAVYPREKWTKGMEEAVEKAAEFYLEREMHVQGDHYEPWYRFHYPVHYYYDLLVGLEFMTALGYGRDKRLGPRDRRPEEKEEKGWPMEPGCCSSRCRGRHRRILCKTPEAGAYSFRAGKGREAEQDDHFTRHDCDEETRDESYRD